MVQVVAHLEKISGLSLPIFNLNTPNASDQRYIIPYMASNPNSYGEGGSYIAKYGSLIWMTWEYNWRLPGLFTHNHQLN